MDIERTCILADLLMNLDRLVYKSYNTDYPIKRLEQFMVGFPARLDIDVVSQRDFVVYSNNDGIENVIDVPAQTKAHREYRATISQ